MVEDMHSNVLEAMELPPGTDLRQALTDARNRKIAEGWVADEIRPSQCSSIFCTKEGRRILVSINACDPALGPPRGHSSRSYG